MIGHSKLLMYVPFNGSHVDLISGANGTLVGGAALATRSGRACLTADGVDDKSTMTPPTSISSFTINSSFSICLWVYIDGAMAPTTFDCFFNVTNIPPTAGFQMYRMNYTSGPDYLGKMYMFDWATGSASRHIVDGDLDAGWNHLAVTWGSAVCKIYANGASKTVREIGTRSVSGTADRMSFMAGFQADGASVNFSPSPIAEFSVWGATLPQSDIRRIMSGLAPVSI